MRAFATMGGSQQPARRLRSKGRYVQDCIGDDVDVKQDRAWVKHLIENEGASVYVCGKVGMGQGVLKELKKLLGSEEVSRLRDARRYLEDTY